MTLLLTDTASTVIRAISAQSDSPDSGGVRISAAAGASDFTLAVVPDAQPSDIVIENDGARIFLDTTAAEALGDAILDAKVGDDGSVSFSVAAQL